MPTVTSIKPQKNGKRVNIYLDGKFGFGIDLENFVILGLKEGNDYSQEKINEIIKKAQFQKTYDKLIRFATLRPRSKKEIMLWLKRKRIHESIYEELLAKLMKLELLDDYKFTSWWVEQRLSFKPRGKKALKYELLEKGIDKKAIDEVFAESNFDEIKIAKSLIKKNEYKWKGSDKFKLKQKKIQFLLRKGIGWETVKKVL